MAWHSRLPPRRLQPFHRPVRRAPLAAVAAACTEECGSSSGKPLKGPARHVACVACGVMQAYVACCAGETRNRTACAIRLGALRALCPERFGSEGTLRLQQY